MPENLLTISFTHPTSCRKPMPACSPLNWVSPETVIQMINPRTYRTGTSVTACFLRYLTSIALLTAPSVLEPGTSWPSLKIINAGRPYT